MDGTAVISESPLDSGRAADASWGLRAFTDINRDGRPDILWHHQASGELHAWFLEGTRVSWDSPLSPDRVADTSWRVQAVADVDEDGKPDVIWQHLPTGRPYVWFLDGLALARGSDLTPSASRAGWRILAR